MKTPSMEDGSFFLGAVILAAGASRRMGQPKLLLEWRGTSIAGHIIEQWRGCGALQVAVVSSTGDSRLHEELDRLRFPRACRIYNAAPEEGMFGSVKRASGWNGWDARITHMAISLGDQPHISKGSLQAVVQCAIRHADSICQPSLNGRSKHPVILPMPLFRRIAGSGASHLKAYLESFKAETRHVPLEDAGLDLDLDTPSEYQRALQLFA